jgi:hypothetical protein
MSEWEVCPLDITEVILDHQAGSRGPIQRIYDRHSRLPQMKRALELYQDHLMHIVGQPARSCKEAPVAKVGITALA